MKHEYLYRKAIEVWGVSAQMDMMVEECAELIKALQKRKRASNTGSVDNILEEMADVEIMLEQLKIIYDYNSGVNAGQSHFNRFKEYKLKRLQKRLE